MMENDVVKCVCTRCSRAPPNPTCFHILNQLLTASNRSQHRPEAEAVKKSLCSGFAIINGGRAGKTHVMRTVCDLWERAGGQLLLATMSGKAALRLSRATGRLARTVFRTLREELTNVSASDAAAGLFTR